MIKINDYGTRRDNAFAKARSWVSRNNNVNVIEEDFYEVEGSSDTYYIHEVTFQGTKAFHCNCEAGQHNNWCYHVALVIDKYKISNLVAVEPVKPSGVEFTLRQGNSITLNAETASYRVTVDKL